MAAVLKTARGRELPRGFESHTLRSHQRKQGFELRPRAWRADQCGLPRMRTCAGGSGSLRLAVSKYAPKSAAAPGCQRASPWFAARRLQPGLVSCSSPPGRRIASSIRPWFALPPGDVCGVDPEQHVHAVPCPFGDLGSRYGSVEPGRYGRVAPVIRPPHERAACAARRGAALLPRPLARRPRPAPVPAPADRPDLKPRDRPWQGLRPHLSVGQAAEAYRAMDQRRAIEATATQPKGTSGG